jgi:hypothetical protein
VLPTRAKTAYNVFQGLMMKEIREKAGCTQAEAMGLTSVEFKKLTPKEQKKYEDLAAKDIARFDREFKELSDKGFFIYEKDGKSSADVQAKNMKKKKKEQEAENELKEEKIEKVKRKKEEKS